MPFCCNCGSKLDSSTKLCAKCGTENEISETGIDHADYDSYQFPEMNQTMMKSENEIISTKEAKTPGRKRAPVLISLFVLGTVLIVGSIFLIIGSIQKNDDSKYKLEYPDIQKYFEENTEIKSITSVKKSENILSEMDVVSELGKRGFSDNPVTTAYSFEGEYSKDTTVSDNSSQKHPMYKTFYLSEKHGIWVIYVIDGTIMATPYAYNLDHPDEVSILLSETEEIVSYDSSTNSFYRTIPKATSMRVKTVERIDSQTLDSIDLED